MSIHTSAYSTEKWESLLNDLNVWLDEEYKDIREITEKGKNYYNGGEDLSLQPFVFRKFDISNFSAYRNFHVNLDHISSPWDFVGNYENISKFLNKLDSKLLELDPNLDYCIEEGHTFWLWSSSDEGYRRKLPETYKHIYLYLRIFHKEDRKIMEQYMKKVREDHK